MKRFVFLLVFFLVLGGLVHLLTHHTQEQVVDPLELVPQQAVFMLDWINVDQTVHNFFTAGFGRTLTSIDWPSVLDQLEITEQVRNHIVGQLADIKEFISRPLFRELFRKRVVCALLPIESTSLLNDPKQALAENFLLLVRPPRGWTVSRMSALPALRDTQVHVSPYQGIPITEFLLQDGGKMYAASIKQLLVLSMGQEPIKRSIDLSLSHLIRQKTGFAAGKTYQELKKRTQGLDDFFFYADLAACQAMYRVFQPKLSSGEQVEMPVCSGCQRMVIFHHSHKNIEQFTSIIQFDPDQPASFQKTIATRKPVENRSLQNMPANLLVYFWSNWLDLPDWWRKIFARGSAEERAAAAGIGSWLEEQTGMKIERFFSLFGHEFGFNVAEIRTSGFFPVPRICFCIELVDRNAVKRILEKMVSGLPLRRDKVAGIPVISIMAAKGLMQPSYALLDKFLVIADSRQQIEDVLEVKGPRLVEDDDFRAVDMGLLQPSNLVMFVRTAGLINGLKEFASWAGTIIAIRDERAGARSKILVDQVIVPLLDGMKMYRAKAVRSFTAPGEVVLESVVLTKNLQKNFSKN